MGVFTIEVLAYALLSNHKHLLLRTDPAKQRKMTDEEVAKRWLTLCPKRWNKDHTPATPREEEIKEILNQPRRLVELRERLGNVSWFMKSINEDLARKANKEDGCTGRFWEGRFKCKKIESEAALLSCSIYIDLNAIRAGLATTPEESRYTSCWERIESYQAVERLKAARENKVLTAKMEAKLMRQADMANWLTPLARQGEQEGYLSMELSEYLELLDWTGRELQGEKGGKIPANLAPLLQRLELNTDLWVGMIEAYGNWFYRYVAPARLMKRAARKAGLCWFKGVRAARAMFEVVPENIGSLA